MSNPNSWLSVEVINQTGIDITNVTLKHRYDTDHYDEKTWAEIENEATVDGLQVGFWTGFGRIGKDYWQIFFNCEGETFTCKDNFYCYLTKDDAKSKGVVRIKLTLSKMYVEPPKSSSDYVSLSRIHNTSKWMGILAKQYPQRQLKNIFIPGTHDSGTYGITEPRTWSLIGGIVGHYLTGPDCANPELEETNKNKIMKLAPDVVRALAKAQEKSVSKQLKDGIRFLDIRPCIRNENDFWISHSIYSVPLDEVLDDISNFLKENTEELIIIDFRFVFGLNGDRERLSEVLWNKVNEKLKNNIISVENPENMASLTLGDISKQNEEGSVILLWDINSGNTKDKHGISKDSAKCGLNTRDQYWADVVGEGDEYDSVEKLRTEISETISNRNKEKMCLVKCEIDLDLENHKWDAIFLNMARTVLPSWMKDAGLRLRASESNPAMKKEIEKSWGKKLEGGYIYTFDFYNIPENLAETIIKLNYRQ